MINKDGTISRVPGSPFDEGLGQPSIIQVTAEAKGRFVYVLNVEATAGGELIGHPGICGFAVDPATGALSRVPGSPIVFPVRNDNNIAVDGSGHFLFEPNLSNTGFDVYSIDQKTGGLTKTSANSNAPPVGSFVNAAADGRLLFNAGKGMVEVFSIAAETGELRAVPGTPTSTAGSAGPIAVTADGKFLYVANQKEGTVMVFAIAANGALTPMNGSPFAIDQGAQNLAPTPDGKFLYVAAFTLTSTGANVTVKGYSVNPSAGAFTRVAGAQVNNANSVTVDLSGQRAYISVTSGVTGGLQLAVYSINPALGALTKIGQIDAPVSDNPFNVVTTP
ncbi:MAG TPA: beta-propeller fold lactonase family protein [Candidatus Angelobacter sp.]|nr:beta-propeller fold lactonase family protein [Candidatus Angelobacter sp.]